MEDKKFKQKEFQRIITSLKKQIKGHQDVGETYDAQGLGNIGHQERLRSYVKEDIVSILEERGTLYEK